MDANLNVNLSAPTLDLQVLIFRSRSQLFCVEISFVNRIIPMTELQTPKEGPTYLKGLLNLHGRKIPIVDVGERFGLKMTTPISVDAFIVLCTNPQIFAGIITEEVLAIERLSSSTLQPQNSPSPSTRPCLCGTLATSKGAGWLLNIQHLIDAPSQKS